MDNCQGTRDKRQGKPSKGQETRSKGQGKGKCINSVGDNRQGGRNKGHGTKGRGQETRDKRMRARDQGGKRRGRTNECEMPASPRHSSPYPKTMADKLELNTMGKGQEGQRPWEHIHSEQGQSLPCSGGFTSKMEYHQGTRDKDMENIHREQGQSRFVNLGFKRCNAQTANCRRIQRAKPQSEQL